MSWALLAEACAAARLEVHRLRHLVTRGMDVIEDSEERDHIYQVAGDILMVAPRRMDVLEGHLDRLSYALSVLGAEELRDQVSLSDRALVDDATHKSAARVAARFLSGP